MRQKKIEMDGDLEAVEFIEYAYLKAIPMT